jgi:hypothetical protein
MFVGAFSDICVIRIKRVSAVAVNQIMVSTALPIWRELLSNMARFRIFYNEKRPKFLRFGLKIPNTNYLE